MPPPSLGRKARRLARMARRALVHCCLVFVLPAATAGDLASWSLAWLPCIPARIRARCSLATAGVVLAWEAAMLAACAWQQAASLPAPAASVRVTTVLVVCPEWLQLIRSLVLSVCVCTGCVGMLGAKSLAFAVHLWTYSPIFWTAMVGLALWPLVARSPGSASSDSSSTSDGESGDDG